MGKSYSEDCFSPLPPRFAWSPSPASRGGERSRHHALLASPVYGGSGEQREPIGARQTALLDFLVSSVQFSVNKEVTATQSLAFDAPSKLDNAKL